jgi:hypothetical protein
MTDVEIKRGPGRPRREEEVATERRRRTGSGAERNLKLFVPEEAKDPNFVYRWVNNRPGRVKQLTQMDDYDVVSSEDGTIDAGTSEGTVVKRTVDRSEGEEAVLLRKPRTSMRQIRLKSRKCSMRGMKSCAGSGCRAPKHSMDQRHTFPAADQAAKGEISSRGSRAIHPNFHQKEP